MSEQKNETLEIAFGEGQYCCNFGSDTHHVFLDIFRLPDKATVGTMVAPAADNAPVCRLKFKDVTDVENFHSSVESLLRNMIDQPAVPLMVLPERHHAAARAMYAGLFNVVLPWSTEVMNATPYRCKHCELRFVSAPARSRHEDACSCKINAKPYTCMDCEKRFDTPEDRQRCEDEHVKDRRWAAYHGPKPSVVGMDLASGPDQTVETPVCCAQFARLQCVGECVSAPGQKTNEVRRLAGARPGAVNCATCNGSGRVRHPTRGWDDGCTNCDGLGSVLRAETPGK